MPEYPSHFVPNPKGPTEQAEFLGGPWDGQVHVVNVGLNGINLPQQGMYVRQERLRHASPARCYRWKEYR